MHTFIGDVHGQAPTLRALLKKLGWRLKDGRLRPKQAENLVFVGDLIDRGRHNLESVELVHELVSQGDATCFMGNHEFNAVMFHTPHPTVNGDHLRPHTQANIDQHQNVLTELESRPGFLRDMLVWFRTLPIAIEDFGWRCVHACWHENSLDRLRFDQDRWYLAEDQWTMAGERGTIQYEACEHLLKGPEYSLPDGVSYLDGHGQERTDARIRWWAREPRTLKEALIFKDPPSGLNLEQKYVNQDHSRYPDQAKPIFFGHYWRTGMPALESNNAVCLDYSAGSGGKLVAYRYRGERQLDPSRFIVQDCI